MEGQVGEEAGDVGETTSRGVSRMYFHVPCLFDVFTLTFVLTLCMLCRSSSFERHKKRERERENYFRPEDAKRRDQS